MKFALNEHTTISIGILISVVGAAFLLGGKMATIEQKVDDLTRLVYQVLPHKLTDR